MCWDDCWDEVTDSIVPKYPIELCEQAREAEEQWVNLFMLKSWKMIRGLIGPDLVELYCRGHDVPGGQQTRSQEINNGYLQEGSKSINSM